jgi:tetratricopeptide repeat protein 21B
VSIDLYLTSKHRCGLLIQGKHDLAQELCKRCLMHNKSCSQAWDVLGLAMEKEMDYEHSYECYEKVWL